MQIVTKTTKADLMEMSKRNVMAIADAMERKKSCVQGTIETPPKYLQKLLAPQPVTPADLARSSSGLTDPQDAVSDSPLHEHRLRHLGCNHRNVVNGESRRRSLQGAVP